MQSWRWGLQEVIRLIEMLGAVEIFIVGFES